MRILAIETSCDETAIAIAEFSGSQKNPKIKILSNIVSSQVKLHAHYGGVVPNLAKREHQRNLVPILMKALKESGISKKYSSSPSKLPRINSIEKIQKESSRQARTIKTIGQILERESELLKHVEKKILPLKVSAIDAIAVTYGPGLAPALWVGVNFAKALSYLWKKPLIPVNHMAGHLYSAFLQKNKAESYQLLVTSYPALALLVSGGHTELVLMKSHGNFKVVGETLDDAAGEAFDKVARILGFSYPGGPLISALTEMKFKDLKFKVTLPRPMINTKDSNFSFSGLKTAVLYLWRDIKHTQSAKIAVAKEFQDAVVEVLVRKTIDAAKKYKIKTILLGGGVSANSLLRKNLLQSIEKEMPETGYLLPVTSMTGDNALMIVLAAFFAGKKMAWNKVGADANLRL